MKDKLKGSDIDPNTVDAQQGRKQQPGAQDAGRSADALDESGKVDAEKLKENRERMRVGDDHKTPDMRKGHRGTFP